VAAYEIPSQYYSNKMNGRNLYVIEGITGSKELFYNDQTFLTHLGQLTANIHTFVTPTDISPDHTDFSPLNIDDKQVKINQLFHHIHSTNHPFTTEMRETINDIGRILSKWNLISAFFKKQQKVFCHNDLSRKNLIHTKVHDCYKFGIYDWGASRFSLPGTDLATHLSNDIFTKLSPQEILTDTRAKKLHKIYFHTMKQEFPHITNEEIEISTNIMFLANYTIRAVQKSNCNRLRHAVYRGLRAIEMLF
jgi:thiamine kinase-like enzyme